MSTFKTLRALGEISAWARRQPRGAEVGITSDDLAYPLAACHNDLDGGADRKWSFTESYAEDGEHRYHYPHDLGELVKRLDERFPDRAVTAGELLAVLDEVGAAFEDEDMPLSAPVGTRVAIRHHGKDYHGARHGCGRCNANGHAYEYRIHALASGQGLAGEGCQAFPDEEEEADEDDDDPLYVEYAPSEQAAEYNCRLVCQQMGWVIAA